MDFVDIRSRLTEIQTGKEKARQILETDIEILASIMESSPVSEVNQLLEDYDQATDDPHILKAQQKLYYAVELLSEKRLDELGLGGLVKGLAKNFGSLSKMKGVLDKFKNTNQVRREWNTFSRTVGDQGNYQEVFDDFLISFMRIDQETANQLKTELKPEFDDQGEWTNIDQAAGIMKRFAKRATTRDVKPDSSKMDADNVDTKSESSDKFEQYKKSLNTIPGFVKLSQSAMEMDAKRYVASVKEKGTVDSHLGLLYNMIKKFNDINK